MRSAIDRPPSEWRDNWPLVLAALVGYMALGLQSYGLSPFVVSLEKNFGWSRASVMAGVSISNFVGIFLNILIGLLVDRIGSRRVGLVGVVVMTISFGLLGTATGTETNWILLWVLIAFGVILTQSTVWTRAVARCFDRSRGAAMAVALCGAPLSAILIPVVATMLIDRFGWRMGFFGIGTLWLTVAFPIVFLHFHDRIGQIGDCSAPSFLRAHLSPPGLSFAEGIRTRAFRHLLISFGCFSFYSMTIATNLIPLLTESGATTLGAGAIASIMGIVGIASRLSVGFLLDRFAGSAVGAVTMLLPVLGCAILLMDQPGTLMLMVAVTAFGAAIGAEVDVALYLATRHFGLRAFAALFGAIITFGAVNASAGPVLAGWLHDTSGNYNALLLSIMAIMSVGALSIATIGQRSDETAKAI